MFGHGVQLNFAGQETYKTTGGVSAKLIGTRDASLKQQEVPEGGGIVSIIINVIMITFAYRKLNTLYFR